MIEFFPTREIALQVGQFAVHWYGIMYLLGFVVAYLLLPVLQKERGLTLTRDQWATVLSYAVIGVIVGGRLGFVLFYEPEYFSENPSKIFAVWEGGMSSHGGFLGVIIMLSIACWRMKIDLRRLADVAVVPVALGLAFGRIGNFINQELYGTVTTLPWGMEFPGAEGLRHPVQLYAMMKDLLIALLCYFHLRYSRSVNPGRTAALFLILYGILRFLVEFVREPDHSPVTILDTTLTRGQLLTLPILLVGLFLYVALRDRSKEE